MSEERITVADGKYTVINDNGNLSALRHGERWTRDLVGDNLVYWMFVRIRELEAIAQHAQEPVGDRYFSYSTDLGFEEYPTRDEAIECANIQIKHYREDAIRDDEWPDEVDSVCWGVILGRSKEIDTSNEDHESVDYKLYTTPPAPQVPAPVDAWMPIDSAPKDGQRLILWWGGKPVLAGWLDNSQCKHPWAGWQTPSLTPRPQGEPTHYMPLPPAPQTKG